jgi:hypothetical protein
VKSLAIKADQQKEAMLDLSKSAGHQIYTIQLMVVHKSISPETD